MNSGSRSIRAEALEAVMSTVLYFDIFRHPLTQDEIKSYIHHHNISDEEISGSIDFLTWHQLLYERDGYYLASPAYENIKRRQQGEVVANKRWPLARKKSNLISKFPFVRGVVISGSLSKGYMDKDSDIDYLIITSPGRLWIARTLLTIYKKIFLLNSHKFFCVNYFLDLENLVLGDRNIFTATELLFAVPTYNPSLYKKFLSSNLWAYSFYPNFPKVDICDNTSITDQPYMKCAIEKLLAGKIGDKLENRSRNITVKFWKKKFKSMTNARFNRDMKNTGGVSKHHPNGFRERVLHQHQEMNLHASRQITEILSAETVFSQGA